jgi:REP element-mobilizing transposase RayT
MPEQAYLVTTVCQDRTPVFLDASLALKATALLNSGVAWPHASVEAWVLMPDHWHGLVVLTSDEPLSRVVQRFKDWCRGSCQDRTGRPGSSGNVASMTMRFGTRPRL